MPEPLTFAYALPGEWWTVPMDDRAKQSIKVYVDRHAGRDDRLAQRRAAIRRELESAAADARRVGAISMNLGVDSGPTVLPMSLTTYRPPVPQHLSWESGPRAASDSLAQFLVATSDGSTVDSWADAEVGVVRDRRSVFLTAENGDQVENLRIDYWVIVAGETQPFLLAFASPVVWEEEREPLAELFEAIVATVTWHDADGPASGRSAPVALQHSGV